jgi:hypothetical protein
MTTAGAKMIARRWDESDPEGVRNWFAHHSTGELTRVLAWRMVRLNLMVELQRTNAEMQRQLQERARVRRTNDELFLMPLHVRMKLAALGVDTVAELRAYSARFYLQRIGYGGLIAIQRELRDWGLEPLE